ncbi:MAG: DMT family transporter [Nitrospinota bacterium]|nr:DMT family transporter [Nitrospinota bacterium]
MLDRIEPNLLSFVAAIFIAVARTMYRAALVRLGAGMVAMLSSVITLTFAWIYYLFFSEKVAYWPLVGVAWFVVIGLVGGLAGRYITFFSMKKVGLARTSVLMQTGLLWSSLLAILFLGERPSLAVGAGSAAIMFGTILLVQRSETERKEISTFYYLLPLAAAMFQGTSHIFRKFGFFWIHSAPLGMSLSNTVATLSLVAVMCFVTEEGGLRFWERRPMLLIFIGGVFNAFAALLFWTAVQHGEIVEVIPINRLSVLLIIFFSWLFFRQQEGVTWRVVTGGLLSVAGAWAIVWGR